MDHVTTFTAEMLNPLSIFIWNWTAEAVMTASSNEMQWKCEFYAKLIKDSSLFIKRFKPMPQWLLVIFLFKVLRRSSVLLWILYLSLTLIHTCPSHPFSYLFSIHRTFPCTTMHLVQLQLWTLDLTSDTILRADSAEPSQALLVRCCWLQCHAVP